MVNDTTLQSELGFEDGTLSSDVTAGLRVTRVLREVALGVWLARLATASAFIRFETEAVTNRVIQQRNAVLLPVPVVNLETRYRLEGNVSVGATCGGDAKFLGFTVAESEVPLATLLRPAEAQPLWSVYVLGGQVMVPFTCTVSGPTTLCKSASISATVRSFAAVTLPALRLKT